MRLREQELADQLQVSRTPVREAVRRLAHELLVDVEPNRGVRVRTLPLEEGLETYEVRLMLEVRAAGLAAERLAAEDIATLRAACRNVTSTKVARDFSHHIRADMHFHATIAQISRHSTLIELIRTLNHRVTRLRALTLEQVLGPDARSQHEEIAEAVLCRNPDKARAAMANHLEYFIRILQSHLEPAATQGSESRQVGEEVNR